MSLGKVAIGFSIFVLALVVGVAFMLSRDEGEVADAPSTTSPIDSSQLNEPNVPDETFTVEQVAEHNSADDCWTIINNTVYDISSYVDRHPGGTEILRACGIDGTSLFEQRTTADGERVGSGTGHSSSAASILAGFEIGAIEQ